MSTPPPDPSAGTSAPPPPEAVGSARMSRRSLLGLLAGAAVVAVFPRKAAARLPPMTGVNFSFLDLDRSAVAACRSRGRGATIAGRGFLRRYAEPGIRDAVRRELSALREQGVDAVRHNVWFIGGNRPPRDVFATGDASPAAAHAGQFAQDLHAAGIGTLLLAFSPVGDAAPACRKGDWGDCFRRDGTDPALAFQSQVAAAAGAAMGPGLLVDPFNEGVPSLALKPPVREAMLGFLMAGLRSAATLQPTPRLVVSTQANRAQERLGLLEQALDGAGLRPDALDIHIYRGRGQGPDDATLGRFRAWTTGREIALVVGELQADVTLMRRVRAVLTRGDAHDPAGYFPWPLAKAETGCHVDIDTSQLLGRMREAARD